MSTAAIGLDPSRHGSLDRMAMPAGTADLSRIVHATDFSAAGEPAFDHALRLAVAAKSHFYLVHARHLAPGQDADWAACPGVRSTLGRWGFLPAGAAPTEVHERLGVRVTKAEVPDRDPVDGVLRFVADNLGNLLVSRRTPGTTLPTGSGARWPKRWRGRKSPPCSYPMAAGASSSTPPAW